MACATANSLSCEFECAICSDQLKQPKYIGLCHHTFCKDCIDKYWASLGWRGTIPCPECRQECPIPQNGVDDLKDNFKLSNIIETYRNQRKRTINPTILTEIRCILCPNGASSFCKDCDLKLCPDCKRRHDRDPKKRDHDFFGLCPSHGIGLLFFCISCQQAICGGCKVSDHDDDDHKVTPIRLIIDNLISRIQTSSTELEDSVRTQLSEQEEKLSHLCENIQQKSTSAEVQAAASTEIILARKRKELEGLREESQNLQEHIDFLVKKKEKVDVRTNQVITEVDKFENEKTKIIADVRERFAKSLEEISQRLRSLETRREVMAAKLRQGRAVGSTKIVMGTECIANLTSISQELMDLVNDSSESDTRTVIEEVMRSISELGVHIVDMGQGLIVMSGDHLIRIGQTKRVFRQLKKVCDVTFPNDRQCEVVYRLKRLHVPGPRLVTLGSSTHSDWSDMIYFHDEVSSSLTGTIAEGVYPAFDMSISSNGEVVVARREKPPIRVFNPATGTYRDINITHDGKVIDRPRQVETDESGSMFVLKSSFDSLLLVVKPNGSAIQSVQLRGYAYNMAFCSLDRIIYVAARDRILRFHWSDNILKEISPSSHGVEDFRCYDVCIGSGGEVFVAGKMENGANVIYQLTEGDEEEDLVWRKIEYQSGMEAACGYWPRICIKHDYLWLGYDDIIEKYQLA